MNDERSTINHRIGDGPPIGAPDAVGDGIAAFAGFEFDSRRDELRKDGVAISLRPKPRALLRHLLDHPGRLLGKEELIRALWGSVVVGDDSLVQCVGELRAALGDRGALIKTLPRRGYMLDTTVERLAPDLRNCPKPSRRWMDRNARAGIRSGDGGWSHSSARCFWASPVRSGRFASPRRSASTTSWLHAMPLRCCRWSMPTSLAALRCSGMRWLTTSARRSRCDKQCE
ncbi:winged helix-turn-helix domain-containing protein [Variovorax ureilyticus]|uniref:winged helix-turn-helix domain-containing protein n=1 Tax=Variovorax ureilyticus TaxID=1836198 RepID=UPI003D671039